MKTKKPFDDYQPPKFWVVAEITEGRAGVDVGYRYRVHGRNFKRLDTFEDAEDAVKADIEANANPNTFGGLIDWGKSSPREYAIYRLSDGKRMK